MRIKDVPNAVAEINRQAKVKHEHDTAEASVRKRKVEYDAIIKANVLKQDTIRANIAMAKLLWELDEEPEPPQKKQKKCSKKKNKKKNV